MPKKPTTTRRKAAPKAEDELYELSDIQAFIAKERRKGELGRLNEVHTQRRVWLRTILMSGAAILLLLSLAIVDLLSRSHTW